MYRQEHRGPDEGYLMGSRNVDPVNGGGDWICTKPEHWIFEGTGMQKGEAIPGLIGWEYHGDPPADIPGLDRPIRARGEGRIKGMPFTMAGSVGPIANWIVPGNKQFFEATARLGQTNARLQGEIRDPIAIEGTSLHITAAGPTTKEWCPRDWKGS